MRVHIEKMIYETVPCACFLYFKSRHKANHYSKAKVERNKSNPTDTSWKDKKLVRKQKQTKNLENQVVAKGKTKTSEQEGDPRNVGGKEAKELENGDQDYDSQAKEVTDKVSLTKKEQGASMLGDPWMVNKFKLETVDPTSRTRGKFKDSVPTLSARSKGEEGSQSGDGQDMVNEVQDQGLSLDLPLVPRVNPPVLTNWG